MATLPTGTVYPGTIDGTAQGFLEVSTGTVISASSANSEASATLAIENVLGTTPNVVSGTTYSNVQAALADRPAGAKIQNQALIYSSDSGSSNNYVVALSPAPAAYAAGLVVVFQAAHASVGGSHSYLTVNSLAAIKLVKNVSQDLDTGDIAAGQIVTAVYDATNSVFQLVSVFTPTLDQVRAPLAAVSMNSQSLQNLAAPVNPNDAGTKVYADGKDWKQHVRVATTGALPANSYSAGVLTASGTGALSVDSVAVNANDRILVKNEATGSHNGIYIVTNPGSGSADYVLTRAFDYNSASLVTPGSGTVVTEGTTNQDTLWILTTTAPVLDTTALTFGQVSGGGTTYTAGTGLTLSSNQFSLTTPVTVANGGTGAGTASGARSNLSAAASGANADITALSALTTPLSVAQGGSGAATLTGVVKGNGTSAFTAATAGTDYMSPANVQNEAATYATSGGSANAYTLTLSPAPSAYAAGQMFTFKSNFANTGSATLNVNSLGAKPLEKFKGTALVSGDIPSGAIVTVVYDGTNFQVISASSIVPVANGGTGATTASSARGNLSAAASGANSDITSLSGLTTALSVAQGGTGATTASGARTNLGIAPTLYQANGNGSTTAFNIGFTPNFPSAILVFVGGLLQRLTTDYTFSGSTVTFGSAPPSGTNNVQVWGM